MSTKKKLLVSAAGAAAGAEALNVEDVFSTYLWTGNVTARTITNGIDLSNEGGLTWIKSRGGARSHVLVDTERGATKKLTTNVTTAETVDADTVTAFNDNGFDIGADNKVNASSEDIASWTFRKAPKFFTCLTYTGTGSAQTISHDLGSVPGCIIVKSTSAGADWGVYHRGLNGGVNPEDYRIYLNLTSAEADVHTFWNDTAPTSTEFTVNTSGVVNDNGVSYVAYLFAHNDGDGEFGPTGDQDIIKCGTWTGTGSVMDINLGFEPQWIMYKRTDAAGSWEIFDNMRGLVVGGASNSTGQRLEANASSLEGTTSPLPVVPTPTGFRNESSFHYTSGRKFIYIAIRRGPMAVPESATDVFGMSYAEDAIDGTFPVDAVITTALSASDNFIRDRLRGTGHLKTNTNGTEGSGGSIGFDHMTGLDSSGWGTGYIHWLWRRAPNFFDVVAYKGNGLSTGHNISHNLGAVPEMIWVKNRETASQDWYVYHKDIGNTHYLRLNATSASVDSADAWNDTTPTDSVFTVGGAGDVNWNNANHIAYLFASLDGVSKVGSYTGSNSVQTIDCGFSSGARFVLIKNIGLAADWFVYDSERGIVAGNDPFLRINDTTAQNTATDYIDPDNSGFIVNGNIEAINQSGSTYIFYAIA